MITYDAYNMAEVFLTQPLLIVAGSLAGSEWMSDSCLANSWYREVSLLGLDNGCSRDHA
jgi:uncharacterized protein